MPSWLTALFRVIGSLLDVVLEQAKRAAHFDATNWKDEQQANADAQMAEVRRLRALGTPDGDDAARRLLDGTAARAGVIATARTPAPDGGGNNPDQGRPVHPAE